MSQPDPTEWTATRAEALARLENFLPRAGQDYADGRNFDLGPPDRSNTSTLSPYLRHRLVTEDEVVAAAIRRHGPWRSQKFVGETCWRTYWKGWLEMRPGVWSDYQAGVSRLLDGLDHDASLRDRFDAATSGRSGIACLDAWAGELVEGGYLHNHARMWFASLWIFTLGLPWELGADFFLRHLMDGDPASNTLSWRWVAGLQTRGKTYLATAGNIARFTNGRLQPKERFAEEARPVEGPPAPDAGPLPPSGEVDPGRPFALLLTEDDLAPETLGLPERTMVGVAAVSALDGRSPWPASPVVARFTEEAVADALARVHAQWGVPSARFERDGDEAVRDWAAGLKVDQVAAPYAPVGPARSRLDRIDDMLGEAGIRLVRVRRRWDDELWPHATSGYFGFKKKLDRSLARLGVSRR